MFSFVCLLTLALVSISHNAGTAVSARNNPAVNSRKSNRNWWILAASKVKFTNLDQFKGDHKLLRTWLFHINEYTELCGIPSQLKKSRWQCWAWMVLL